MITLTEKEKSVLDSLVWEYDQKTRYRPPVNMHDSVFQGKAYTYNEEVFDASRLITQGLLVYAGEIIFEGEQVSRYVIDYHYYRVNYDEDYDPQ